VTTGLDEVVDVLALGQRLVEEARATGKAQGIRVIVRQPGQRVILLGLPAGGGLPDHTAPGPASLVCVSGEVVLRSGDESWTLPEASAHVIPQAVHDLKAQVDSVCVLTVSAD